jgi:hypothetical protein
MRAGASRRGGGFDDQGALRGAWCGNRAFRVVA